MSALAVASEVLGFPARHAMFMVAPWVLFGVAVSFLVRGPWAKALAFGGGFVAGWSWLLWGPSLNHAFLLAYGQRAEGVITAQRDTSVRVNHRDARRFEVLFKDSAGATQRTDFPTWAPMVHPSSAFDSPRYPQQGERFELAYVPGAESNFVILGTGDAPFARALACEALSTPLGDATRAREFAPDNDAIVATWREAMQRYIDGDCPGAAAYRAALETTVDSSGG